ncbi:MAG: 16S rRNA (uracil(1498)-N(3))-methyltransferase [Phycisphaerae bacterium]|nr:16S rRNA (uracil(1498)-N(3))-methyltransferase [Phycisphaerae bacterium]
MHTLFLPELSPTCDEVVVDGDEAVHAARVKRLRAGEMVRGLDGRGTLVVAEVVEARRVVRLRVVERRHEARVIPAVHVLSATPKGPRIAELVEGLVQVGAASWTPMQTRLGVVDPRESKLERMERVVVEASKQSGRAWLMEVREKRAFGAVFEVARACGARVVLADAGGERYRATGAESIFVLVGPEGGFTEEEVAEGRRSGALVCRFGPHAMRIETASVVAAAMILNEECRATG